MENLDQFILNGVEGLSDRREKGRGCYGAVYEVRINGVPCIAKRLHDILVGRGPEERVSVVDRRAAIMRFREECLLLSGLRHPNIVQMLGVHYGGSDEADISLIMEYMHMDLEHCMKTYPSIPLPYKTSILRDVVYGLAYLHSIPIIHRDLNAGNVLLTESLRAKIADLGVAKLLDRETAMIRTRTVCPGALDYMPPEALERSPKYGSKLDTFSFGHLTIYLANEEVPRVSDSMIRVEDVQKKQVQVGKRRQALDQMGGSLHPLYSTVVQCLSDTPDQRPTSTDLVKRMEKFCNQHPVLHENTLHMLAELTERQKFETELKNELIMKHAELSELEKELNGQLTKLNEELERKEHKLTESRKETVMKDRQLAALKEEIATKDRQLTVVRREIAAKDRQLTDLRKDTAAKNRQLTALREETATKNRQLTALREETATKDHQLTALREETATKNRQLTALREETATKNRQLTALREETATKDRQLTALREETATKDHQLTDLREKLRQKEVQSQQLENYVRRLKSELNTTSHTAMRLPGCPISEDFEIVLHDKPAEKTTVAHLFTETSVLQINVPNPVHSMLATCIEKQAQLLKISINLKGETTIEAYGTCSQLHTFREFLVQLFSTLSLFTTQKYFVKKQPSQFQKSEQKNPQPLQSKPASGSPLPSPSPPNTLFMTPKYFVKEQSSQFQNSEQKNPQPLQSEPASGSSPLPSPPPPNARVIPNLSCDVLLLMPKLPYFSVPGVQYRPREGLVFFVEDPQDVYSAAFIEKYRKVMQTLQTTNIHIQVEYPREEVRSIVASYNQRYKQCHFSFNEHNSTIKIISASSRHMQFQQAKKFLMDIFWRHAVKDIEKFTFSKGRTLTVKKANIVEEKCTVIVNLANSQLSHEEGVAGALNEASNGELQRLSDKHTAQFGTVPVGNAVQTMAGGRLKCKFVLHAVGPNYSESGINGQKCYQLIKQATTNTLQAAQKLNAASITFPSLGTGMMYGFYSHGTAADAMINAIEEFKYLKLTALTDIRIVITDTPVHALFAQEVVMRQYRFQVESAKGYH